MQLISNRVRAESHCPLVGPEHLVKFSLRSLAVIFLSHATEKVVLSAGKLGFENKSTDRSLMYIKKSGSGIDP